LIRSKNKLKGFTLVEAVVAIAIAGILIGGVIQLYSVLVKAVKAGREQTVLAALTSNYLEIVRNLPFSEIGTAFGNPNGNLPDQNDPIEVTIENKLYRIYYEVTWIDDPADGTILAGTDVAADDYKQVKMNILNTATSVVKSFVTSIVPKGLEGTDNAGALVLNVIDASGQPVAGASVHIENTAGTIILDRTTDANGNWIEVSLPPGVNSYHIVVTKAGYSTDSTYPLTVDNPNPTKPDSTINVGVIT
jgi:prepilin-type N-terminal cleavage/methylation domain-containing protein